MTLINPNARIRTLRCDHDGCDWTFAADRRTDRLATVRASARSHGWRCDNPGPGKPSRDLCPRHKDGR